MTTDKGYVHLVIDRLRDGRVVFTHSPEMWSECRLPTELNWLSVPFTAENRRCVPRDKFGVYAFMLEPDFSGPPRSAYLLYIGKTGSSRGFRRRYGDYLYDQRSEDRVVISRMLQRWNGHIKFYYAIVEDVNLVDEIELALLDACIPPYNDRFDGRTGAGITAFRRESGG